MGDGRWIILGVLFVARTAMSFQFQTIAGAAPHLVRTLGIGYAEIGALIGLYLLPGAVLALPGGLIGRRFGDKSVAAAGLALMALGGAIVGLGDGYGVAFAGRLLSGVGAVLFNLVLTKMATDWFAGREIVFAMAVVLASWPFGIAAGLLVDGPIAQFWGWRWIMFSAALLCAAGLILVVALYHAPSRAVERPVAAAPSRHLSLPSRSETLPTVVAGLIWGVFNLGLVLFFSFAPPVLVERGLTPVVASSVTSLALWICIFSVPLGGFAVERMGRPGAAIVLFSAIAGVALALLPLGAWPALLCAIFGIAIGPPAGAIMALPARVLRVENRAAGLGLFYTCYYVINAAGPALGGALGDGWGTAAATMNLAALLLIAVAPLLFVFERLAAPDRRGVAAQRGLG
jgi:predicted MFS family arabinose efflux permease